MVDVASGFVGLDAVKKGVSKRESSVLSVLDVGFEPNDGGTDGGNEASHLGDVVRQAVASH